MSVDRLSRRRALSGLASVGSIAVVGCLGGGRQSLTVGVGPAGSRSHQAGHALAVAVDRHSDRLTLNIESRGPQSQRLYAVSNGKVAAAGVDNTTLYRASEDRGVFDLDPIERLPHQGFAYGHREQYWLAVDDEQTASPESTAGLADGRVVHPGQPSEPSRLVTEQLLRDADLWDSERIDNRPQSELAAALSERAVDCLVAVQHSGQELTSGSQAVDEQVGERLTAVPIEGSFQAALDDAPNAVDREITPVGWAHAELADTVDGWVVPMQWLWSPSTDPEVVDELTRIAHDHSETIRSVDPLALDGTADGLSESVVDGVALHEGTATAFRTLDNWNGDWTVGDAVN